MAVDKVLLSGSTTMLLLKLLEGHDMYGYQMIKELHKQSDETFNLNAGTLYPLLHGLENENMVYSYEINVGPAMVRKYYHLTSLGKEFLDEKREEWGAYTNAVNRVLDGGVSYAAAW